MKGARLSSCRRFPSSGSPRGPGGKLTLLLYLAVNNQSKVKTNPAKTNVVETSMMICVDLFVFWSERGAAVHRYLQLDFVLFLEDKDVMWFTSGPYLSTTAGLHHVTLFAVSMTFEKLFEWTICCDTLTDFISQICFVHKSFFINKLFSQ